MIIAKWVECTNKEHNSQLKIKCFHGSIKGYKVQRRLSERQSSEPSIIQTTAG